MKLILTSLASIVLTLIIMMTLLKDHSNEKSKLILPQAVLKEINKNTERIIYLAVVRTDGKKELISRDGKVIEAPIDLIDPDELDSDTQANTEVAELSFVSKQMTNFYSQCSPIQDDPLPSWTGGDPNNCLGLIKDSGDSGQPGSHCHCY